MAFDPASVGHVYFAKSRSEWLGPKTSLQSHRFDNYKLARGHRQVLFVNMSKECNLSDHFQEKKRWKVAQIKCKLFNKIVKTDEGRECGLKL